VVAQRECPDRSARGEDFYLATSEDIKLAVDSDGNRTRVLSLGS